MRSIAVGGSDSVGTSSSWRPSRTASALRVGYNEDAIAALSRCRAAARASRTRRLAARQRSPGIDLEPADGEFDSSTADRVMALFRSAEHPADPHGLRLVRTGPFRIGPRSSARAVRAGDASWIAHVAGRRAAVIPTRSSASGTSRTSPASEAWKIGRMAELVNEAAHAIWEVSPGRRVLGPPVAPVGGWAPYARKLYSRLDHRVEMAANAYPYARRARRGASISSWRTSMPIWRELRASRAGEGDRCGSPRPTCPAATSPRGARPATSATPTGSPSAAGWPG